MGPLAVSAGAAAGARAAEGVGCRWLLLWLCSNRHPLVGEVGSAGERKKLLLLQDFADFVVIGRMQSGKSTLLQTLASLASDTAAVGEKGATAAGAKGGVEGFSTPALCSLQQGLPPPHETPKEQLSQQQEQPQDGVWLSAAVPREVWVPTTEPAVAILPAAGALETQQHPQGHQEKPEEVQQLLEQSLMLAAAAPLVALDTPGMLPPPAATAGAQIEEGAAAASPPATPTAVKDVAPEDLLVSAASPLLSFPLQSLCAASGVLVVVDASLPVRLLPLLCCIFTARLSLLSIFASAVLRAAKTL